MFHLLLFVHAQELQVAGKVMDKSGTPVPYVNIYLSQSRAGTVTNEAGEFQLPASAEKGDTVVFSHIGYKRKTVLVSEFSGPAVLQVFLTEDVRSLREITINARRKKQGADDIVRRAIRNLYEKTDREARILTGYYRHATEQDGSYKQLVEAAISVYEPEFSSGTLRINIDKLRRSYDFREVLDAKQGVKLTEEQLRERDSNSRNLLLSCWYRNNVGYQLVRSDVNEHGINDCGAIDFGLLNEQFLREHKFKLDSTSRLDEHEVYVIKILPNARSKPYYTFPDNLIIPLGKIFIRANDYAILRFEYQYVLNPSKRTTDDFQTTYAVFGSGIIFKIIATFREHDNKVYLSYLHTQHYQSNNLPERRARQSSGKRVYTLVDRRLLINQIIKDNTSVSASLKSKPWVENFLMLESDQDEEFWQSFNTLPETKEQEQLRKRMEKPRPNDNN